jgi:hypothetical protein
MRDRKRRGAIRPEPEQGSRDIMQQSVQQSIET